MKVHFIKKKKHPIETSTDFCGCLMHAQSAVLVRDLVGTGLLFFLWLDDPIKKVLMGHGLQNQFISKCWQIGGITGETGFLPQCCSRRLTAEGDLEISC